MICINNHDNLKIMLLFLRGNNYETVVPHVFVSHSRNRNNQLTFVPHSPLFYFKKKTEKKKTH